MTLAEQFLAGAPDPFTWLDVSSPDKSFAEVLELVEVMNHDIRDSGVTEKLKKWIEKLRETLSAIARAFNAAAYAVSIGATGLSVSITFNS